jgi:acyl dehydratase
MIGGGGFADAGEGNGPMKIDELQPGLELGPSEWKEIRQDRIDAFADATGDHQWIHVDPERAADGPFGTTVAHGFLTLSMLPEATFALMRVEDASAAINYGLDKVRFPAPVPVGSRIRASFRIADVSEVPGGVQVKTVATVEREGGEKPVCVAETLSRYYR